MIKTTFIEEKNESIHGRTKEQPYKKMDSLYKKVVQLYKIMSINQQKRSVLGHDDEKAQKVDFVTLLEDFLPSTLVFFSDVIPSP